MCDIHPTSCTGATPLFDLLSQNSHFPLSLGFGHAYLVPVESLLDKDSSDPYRFQIRSVVWPKIGVFTLKS